MSNLTTKVVKFRLNLLSLFPEVTDKTKEKIKIFNPITGISVKWKEWYTLIDIYTCKECLDLDGHIFSISEYVQNPPLHYRCRCILDFMETIKNGTASIEAKNSADYYIYNYGFLPSNYVKKSKAKELGWKSILGNLYEIDKLIGGDIYLNKDRKLPHKDTRIGMRLI